MKDSTNVKRLMKRRGFKVESTRCKKVDCDCFGQHYSISGHGIRKNNLTDKDIDRLAREYPLLSKKRIRSKH